VCCFLLYNDAMIGEVLSGRAQAFVPRGLFPISPCVVCCGSFNPLHPGHVELLKLGEDVTGLTGVFELSISNVDKPPLDQAEVDRRSRQFEGLTTPLVLTNQPRYLGKLAIFPRQSAFVMGADTFVRLVDGRYYNDSESPLVAFESFQTRFVVTARQMPGGSILDPREILSTNRDSARWSKITTCIPQDRFLMNISSTQLRSQLPDSRTTGANL
jgi:nicotinic acid mononucleotide adenylyltransferase